MLCYFYLILCLIGIVLSIQVVIYAILFPFNFMLNWYYFIYPGCDLCYAILCLIGIALSI
jgi:hypothetical protein